MRSTLLLLAVFETAFLVGALRAGEDRYGDPLPVGALQRLGTLRLRFAEGIGDLCHLPDGRGAFAVEKRVEIWDLAQGKLQVAFQVADSSLVSIVPRRDGRAVLLADGAGNVREWDLADKRELRSWNAGQSGLRRACYSPDETHVLTTGAKPPTIKEWELASGAELIAITGEMHYFHEAIYGPDGKTAYVNGGAGSGPVLAHYDLATGEPLKEWLKDYYTHGRSITLSADRRRLLVGSRHKATEWQLDGSKLLQTFTGHHGHAVTAVAYCREPDQLLTGSRDGSIRRWDRLKNKVLLRWFPHDGHVIRIAVSPDGKRVLSYGARVVADCSVATGEPRIKWERHSGPVQAVAFLPNGQHVVSASTDTTLRLWNITTGSTVRVIQDARLGAYAVAVSPDGERVAAGCKDGVLREFRLGDGRLLRELHGHRGYVRSVAYTHDGKRLLSSAGDGSICVWHNDAGEPAMRLKGHQGGVLSVAISRDDKLLVTGGRDGTVRGWNLAQGQPLVVCEGHRGWVEAVTFVGDGNEALSTGHDGRVLRWDLNSGKLVDEMQGSGRNNALVCSRDGARAYSAGSNKTITCWDLATGKQVAELEGHQLTVHSLALSPNHLASASSDTTLLVWGLSRWNR